LDQYLNLPDLVPLIWRFLYCIYKKIQTTTTILNTRDATLAHPAVRSWRGGASRYDCVFIEGDPDLPGFSELLAVRALFMSFTHRRITYPCAVVTWFSAIGDEPCSDVSRWMVEPDVEGREQRVTDIIRTDTILRGAHLIGIHSDISFLDI
jgi:hypothetical protein